jgi:saccharopine dehydrogenase-like NADP-dependent oxidoreductase
MKNVIILGASGNIAGHVIDILVKRKEFNLTRTGLDIKTRELLTCTSRTAKINEPQGKPSPAVFPLCLR